MQKGRDFTTLLYIIPQLRKLLGLYNSHNPGKPGVVSAFHRNLNTAPGCWLSANRVCGVYRDECEIVSVLAVVAWLTPAICFIFRLFIRIPALRAGGVIIRIGEKPVKGRSDIC
jgi:hypothetical protein